MCRGVSPHTLSCALASAPVRCKGMKGEGGVSAFSWVHMPIHSRFRIVRTPPWVQGFAVGKCMHFCGCSICQFN